MGEARKDRQLRMDAVLLEIFLQALHTGYAVIAIRGVADKLVVELADTDEDGYLLYGFEVDIITEVILEITDTPEVVLVWIQEGRISDVSFCCGSDRWILSDSEKALRIIYLFRGGYSAFYVAVCSVAFFFFSSLQCDVE